VEIVPRRGAFVVDLTREDAREIYDLREVLEGCAIRNFQADAKTFGRLRASVRAAEKYFRANDRTSYAREDARFHTLIAAAGGTRD
jgi:DNA-binding GntR family transcriptional regulator